MSFNRRPSRSARSCQSSSFTHVLLGLAFYSRYGVCLAAILRNLDDWFGNVFYSCCDWFNLVGKHY